MCDVGMVFGVVVKLRLFCNVFVLCLLSCWLDKFIIYLFLLMYGFFVIKVFMLVSFCECLFLIFFFNLLVLWLINLESVLKCFWEIIDDNLCIRLEYCLFSCLIFW